MARTHSHAEIAALAKGTGLTDAQADGMAHVADCESGGDANVVGHNRNGSTDTGLWQINSIHLRAHPTWSVAWLKNPKNNAAAMKVLRDADGMQPWSASMPCWLPKVSSNALGGTIEDPIGTATNAAGDPLGAIEGLVAPVAGFVSWITDPVTWRRMALVVIGGGIAVVGVAAVARGTEAGRQVESAVKAGVTRGAVS
jgi:hypothetical protein